MTRLVTAARRYPWLALLCLMLIAGPLGFLVATASPPDPSVRQLPMAWQRVARPILNVGVDATGTTLPQHVAAGKAAETWRPLPLTSVYAGEVFFVLRRQEFRNKLADPLIQRKFLCGRVTIGTDGYPIIDVNGQVGYDIGPVEPPGRTDGAKVSNYPVRVPRWVGLDGNGQPLMDGQTCVYQPSAKFMKNPWQSVGFDFAPVAVTILPPRAP